MKKFKNKFKFLKNGYFWIFIGIFLAGAFLRAYNFSPWLHFELDQSRDATLVGEAVENGAGNLPLLGPRAAGTFLRLGPAFYYIEYVSALVFGNSPSGMAMAILIFSLLSIPAFYLLLRRYFSNKITLVLLMVFSVSTFMVVYSRFAWNPNLLPFFSIMLLWTLLKSTDAEEGKRMGYWLLACAFFFGVLAQLHFLALIIFGATAVLFLSYKRPKIKPIFWVGSVLIILFLHLPMVINEAKTQGHNSKLFIEAITDKSDSKKSYTLVEKGVRNVSENILKYWIIISGSQKAEIPELRMDGETGKYDIRCDKICRDNLHKGVLASGFFFLGIIFLVARIFLEKIPSKKDFLVSMAFLLAISLGVFTPLAFDMSPRFFLIVAPLPFVFLGLIIDGVGKFLRIKNLAWALGAVLAAFSLYFTIGYLSQLDKAISDQFSIGSDRILKQKTRITLEQQEAITDYMESFYKKNNYAVFYHGQSEFHRAFAYLLDKRKIPRDGISKKDICRQGNYFLIIRTQSDIKKYDSYFEMFDLIEGQQFGTLTIFHLSPKPAIINCERPDESKFRNYKNEGGAVAKRFIWEEIFEEESEE
ncbi:MAG: glycosyltransferase family 39 protein [Parcubacteria group bacterium]|jgi:4-amino-4-deoxy-L-arabinose transferase-like glycosyltransferase|nr:glycosyltransferase family 39 protein [Candidatus Moranbacteria bacterium]